MHPRGVAGAFCCPRPAAKPVENLTRFYGHDLVLLPSGPRYIDMSAWHRPEHNFYSGNAPLHDRAAAAAARAAKPQAQHG